jgi:hypothetical protein
MVGEFKEHELLDEAKFLFKGKSAKIGRRRFYVFLKRHSTLQQVSSLQPAQFQ